jgi:hypothetical protein
MIPGDPKINLQARLFHDESSGLVTTHIHETPFKILTVFSDLFSDLFTMARTMEIGLQATAVVSGSFLSGKSQTASSVADLIVLNQAQ